MSTTTLTIRLPIELKDQLDAAAKATERSITDYVTRALKVELDADTRSRVLRLPNDLDDLLEKAAEESDRSVNDYILHAIKMTLGVNPLEVVMRWTQTFPSGAIEEGKP